MPPYERQAEPSKGNFLSWDAGESKDLVILSEKGKRAFTHWVAGAAQECAGEGCALCREGLKRTIRWSVSAKCEGEELPWEMSNRVFFGVEDVAEMVGGLKDLRLRVTRHGTGMKTRYSVLPISSLEPPPDEEKSMAWLIEEIKRLCALDNRDAKQEYKLFFAEVVPGVTYATPLDKMRTFYNYINEETKDLQPVDEPPPDEPQDIGRYF